VGGLDFENLHLRVVRKVVHGRVKMVETEYSEDELPLDTDFAAILRDRKRASEDRELSLQGPDPTPSMGLALVIPSAVRPTA
jgi:hypothetical protein